MALLITGLAFGWNLVSFQVVASSHRKSRLIRLLLAFAGGAVVVLLLTLARPPVGLAASLVFLSSALVGYAGSARQTSSSPQTDVRELERSRASDARMAVMLVHDGEPLTYEGPADWAERLARWQSTRCGPRHWLTHPRVYARVRAAYDQMGERCDYNEALAGLGHALARSLGTERVVGAAFLRGGPRLAETLSRWTEMGISKILIVPIRLDAVLERELRDHLTRSRARQVGLRIRFAPWRGHADWQPLPESERFGLLVQGSPLPAPTVSPNVVADLGEHVLTHLLELA